MIILDIIVFKIMDNINKHGCHREMKPIDKLKKELMVDEDAICEYNIYGKIMIKAYNKTIGEIIDNKRLVFEKLVK